MSPTRMLSRGFALPTILIASVVMMIVMLSATTVTVSINNAIDAQYYNSLAQEAADSGVAMAKACIDKDGNPEWDDATPLHPNSDCNGSAPACSGASSGTIVDEPNIKTSFCVGEPEALPNGAYLIQALSSTQLLRTSDSAPWRTYTSDGLAVWPTDGEVVAPVEAISAGDQFACAIRSNGGVYCWGGNLMGNLGRGFNSASEVDALRVEGLLSGKTVTKISSGPVHSCAVTDEPKVYCWGNNNHSQLGNNSITSSYTPVAVLGLNGLNITDIAVGGGNNVLLSTFSTVSCALTDTGQAYCWGSGSQLQIGDGRTSGNATTAVPVSGGLSFKEISIGTVHVCALTTAGKAYCWGRDTNGQIGNSKPLFGSPVGDESTPSAVKGVLLSTVFVNKTLDSISAGQLHTCAHATDNTVWCWGSDSEGQQGHGATSARRDEAIQMPFPAGVNGYSQVVAGGYGTCAIGMNNGNYVGVYCMGDDGVGQVGNGLDGIGTKTVPTPIDTTGVLSGGKVITNVVSGLAFRIAQDSQGDFYSWGQASSGQLGNGTRTLQKASPVEATILN